MSLTLALWLRLVAALADRPALALVVCLVMVGLGLVVAMAWRLLLALRRAAARRRYEMSIMEVCEPIQSVEVYEWPL